MHFEDSPHKHPSAAPSSAVSSHEHGNGVFSIRVSDRHGGNTLSSELCAQLVEAIDTVRQAASAKVLILSGAPDVFLSGGRAHHNEAVRQGLYQAIVRFPYPVIAALQGNAGGAGFLVGALCDFMVCSQSATYHYVDARQGLFPTEDEDRLFSERLGRVHATDFLYLSSECTGRALREKGWSCPIVPPEQVETHVGALASSLAQKSQSSLRLLKEHLAHRMLELTNALAPVECVGGQPQAGRGNADVAITAPGKHIQVTAEDAVVILRICDAKKKHSAKTWITDLSKVVTQINQRVADPGGVGYRAIVLVSEHEDFLPLTHGRPSADDVLDLGRVLCHSSLPVVAVLSANASGRAWLISQFCDSVVYAHEGSYCAADLLQSPDLASLAARMFTYRFGTRAGRDILLAGVAYSGTDLQRHVGPLPVVPQDRLLPAALKLARNWATWPLEALTVRGKLDTFSTPEDMNQTAAMRESDAATPSHGTDAPAGTLTAIALESKAITATVHSHGIVVVRMEDRDSKNLFSDEFVRGMQEVFRHIEQAADYKVVVLCGYDTYFASGGTKEALVAIQEGKAKFTDNLTYQLALTCKIPVIAVMQGHGIGAGLSLGLFADFPLLSEESKYVSPYMSYGFTPGAGATLIGPEMLGHDLARETLLSAQEYAGSELRNRGVLLPVYPRRQLHEAAMSLAESIARHSRGSLIAMKQRLNRTIHARLDQSIQREIAMHELTFVGQATTLEKIKNAFNPMESDIAAQPAQSTDAASVLVPQNNFAVVRLDPAADTLLDIPASLKKLLAQELHMRVDDIDEDTQFVDLGLDSITGVTWTRKINDQYRTSIEAMKVYSYPNLAKLSAFVSEEVQKLGARSAAPQPAKATAPERVKTIAPERVKAPVKAPLADVPSPQAPVRSDLRFSHKSREKLSSWRGRSPAPADVRASSRAPTQPIAVIGMAGQFPKALTLEQFWQNIAQGRNCISEIPKSRWDVGRYYLPGGSAAGLPGGSTTGLPGGSTAGLPGGSAPGKTNSRWMGLLEEFDLFDPLFFEISPLEAHSMDPQQRVFLQACWHAIENAGYNPKSFAGSKCGVFVGCGPGDYHLLSRDLQISGLGFTGGDTAILPARVSYFLDLQGPCLAIETACSSSIVAIATACDSLVAGNSDMALAGGVCVVTGPELHIKTAQKGMLSKDGRCFTFDQRANGFVPGEGVGAVLLKRLSDAERDQDIILGVIEGWGINQDGKTNGITAPNPESQKRLQQDIYDRYQIDPAAIQLIEAHGTGTQLGDPIEVDALKQSFRKYTQKAAYCALGSIKSNIGHCLTAAGIASVTKVLLALRNRKLPPTINFEQLNENIDLKDSPFYVNDRLRDWELHGADSRRAAISGFGFGGTNAHLVIAEYASPVSERSAISTVTESGKIIIPLSAKTAERLKQKAGELSDFIRENGRRIDLSNMAYTLQVGREAMEERVGFLVSSLDELGAKLSAFAHGEGVDGDIHRGQVSRNKDDLGIFRQDAEMRETLIDKWVGQGKLSQLLKLWVRGLELDWNKLYGASKPQRIELPGYPFAKERYWIDPIKTPPLTHAAASASVLHPLLHVNTSDLNQQSYRTTFSGEELFLADHQVSMDGDAPLKVLPGVAYLEMARVAVEKAAPNEAGSRLPELHNVVWLQPIVVTAENPISIALFVEADKQIDFEICSGEDTLHCQGRVALNEESASEGLDLEQLKRQMERGWLDAASVYAAFTRMGLHYGPAHQALSALELGDGQLLAHLSLPACVRENREQYVLHPSLLDGALQAAIGLAGGELGSATAPHATLRDVALQAAIGSAGDELASSVAPHVPFSLDALRIITSCTPEMIAWVRHSAGSRSNGAQIKVDIDLCDSHGNVCVQMRGFCARAVRASSTAARAATHRALNESSIAARTAVHPALSESSIAARTPSHGDIGTLFAVPVWQARATGSTSARRYGVRHVLLCDLPHISVQQLQAQIAGSQCESLQARAQANLAERYGEHAQRCFEHVQRLLRSKPSAGVLLQIVIGNQPEQAILAGLGGLLRSAALENPRLTGQIILVPPQWPAEPVAQCLQQDVNSPEDTIIHHGESQRRVLRWQALDENSAQSSPIAFKDRGVYLITGGLGALGVLFAREILQQTTQAHVILTGRSALTEAKQALLAQLSTARMGCVSYRQIQLDDARQSAQLLAQIKQEHGQLNGILHSAGMAADNFVLKKPAAEFNEVLTPKVIGTFNLDQASRDLELDFFVLFSSVAAAMGNVGQADYAAANGFMDQFAAHRNRLVAAGERRGRTLAINWPLWAEGGMALDAATQQRLQRATGMQPMRTSTGVQALHRCLALQADQVLVMEGDVSMLPRVLAAQTLLPEATQAPVTAQGLAAAQSSLAAQDSPAAQSSLAAQHSTGVKSSFVAQNSVAGQRLAAASSIDAHALLESTQNYLRCELSELLKLPSHRIDAHAPLENYGIDSILAINLTQQLEKTFGSLSKTLFFEYQSIAALSEYFVKSHSTRLATLFAPADQNRQPEPQPAARSDSKPARSGGRFRWQRLGAQAPTPARAATDAGPIAIIGVSGRYPQALDLEAYWVNLREGKDCITEVPQERWEWREYFSADRSKSGHHYSKWGGFIAGVDEFDPMFFNISPREAEVIDPQERLFLQHAWMAIEDAGYTRASLQMPDARDLPGQVGVYVGAMYSEYQLFAAETSAQGQRMAVSSSYASIANRVSYALNLHGPSMALDTMCSSSLSAIHLACQDLRAERTSLAIAGGVNVSIHPNKYLLLSAGQFISSDGHCQSFGEGGDGYIPGEGVGVVILKRLSEAERDGDPIYGVILGSALNHGGKTNGYSVPNPQAQSSAISRALAEANVDARHISYVEAHGTGTKLGDPIEIAALSSAFQRHTAERSFCLIGSAKSNIGHCESAAGIAALNKVLLQMEHRQIAPSLHAQRLNPHIDFDKTPFVVNQSLRAWEQPVIDGQTLPRIAGISSFGAGGSNAHMIVQEYVPPAKLQQSVVLGHDAPPLIVPLSARTAEQLKQKARDLLQFVRRRETEQSLDGAALAYTLQVGREPMEERLGLIVSSLSELIEKLQAHLDGEPLVEGVYQGQVKPNKETVSLFNEDRELQDTVEKWMARRQWSKLLDLWVKGLHLDWNKLYAQSKPRRISLPTYPFARNRYWLSGRSSLAVVEKAKTPAGKLHPLVHTNASVFGQQGYNSVFSGDEPFLVQLQSQQDGRSVQKVLPAVAYLEMARVAVEKAMPTSHELNHLELRNIACGRPLIATSNRQVNIALFWKSEEQVDFEIYSLNRESSGLGDEIVHCQGQAVLLREAVIARLDLQKLKHEAQLLVPLRSPSRTEASLKDYVLQPALLESALQASTALIKDSSRRPGHLSFPFAMESIRIGSVWTEQMFVWARFAQGSHAQDALFKLDIDLCDRDGNVCVQMRGITYEQVSVSPIQPADQGAAVALERRDIALDDPQAQTFAHSASKKPTEISLQ